MSLHYRRGVDKLKEDSENYINFEFSLQHESNKANE
jgi:hypothetical protein